MSQAQIKTAPSFFILSLVFAAMLIMFTVIVRTGWLGQFDIYVLTHIQARTPISFDTTLSLFSSVGSFEIMTFLVVMILIFFHRQGFSWKDKALILVIYAAGHGLEILGKTFFHHPGPPREWLRFTSTFIFPSSSLQLDSSYPSGHSFRIFFLYLLGSAALTAQPASTHHTKNKIGLYLQVIGISVLSILTMIMIFSRVSLAEHWPTDVIAGSLLGLSFGCLSLSIAFRKPNSLQLHHFLKSRTSSSTSEIT